MDKPLKSGTHGQCNVRPAVTFPGAGHHRPLTLSNYTAWQRTYSACCLKVERPRVDSDRRPIELRVQRSDHYTLRCCIPAIDQTAVCWQDCSSRSVLCTCVRTFLKPRYMICSSLRVNFVVRHSASSPSGLQRADLDLELDLDPGVTLTLN